MAAAGAGTARLAAARNRRRRGRPLRARRACNAPQAVAPTTRAQGRRSHCVPCVCIGGRSGCERRRKGGHETDRPASRSSDANPYLELTSDPGCSALQAPAASLPGHSVPDVREPVRIHQRAAAERAPGSRRAVSGVRDRRHVGFPPLRREPLCDRTRPAGRRRWLVPIVATGESPDRCAELAERAAIVDRTGVCAGWSRIEHCSRHRLIAGRTRNRAYAQRVCNPAVGRSACAGRTPCRSVPQRWRCEGVLPSSCSSCTNPGNGPALRCVLHCNSHTR